MILVKTIKTVIKNINRYTVHESGCNIIRELIVKSPIFYNRPQEIIDEKEYMPVTDRNKDYIKLQTQSTKLCYDLLGLSNGCFERCLKKYCPCNCHAEMIMMACPCQQRHHLHCLLKYEVPECFKCQKLFQRLYVIESSLPSAVFEFTHIDTDIHNALLFYKEMKMNFMFYFENKVFLENKYVTKKKNFPKESIKYIMDLVSKTVDETSAKIQTLHDTPDKSLGNKQKSNSSYSSYNPKLPHLNSSQDRSETQDKSGLVQDSPAHAQLPDDGLVDTDTETDDDDVNNNTKKRKSGVLSDYEKKKQKMLKNVQEMQKIQQDFIDLKDMTNLEYVRPLSRDATNPLPSCLVEDGIPARNSVYVGHKSDGTNMKLMTKFIEKAVIGIERDENTLNVNETDKTTKVFDPEFVSQVKKD